MLWNFKRYSPTRLKRNQFDWTFILCVLDRIKSFWGELCLKGNKSCAKLCWKGSKITGNIHCLQEFEFLTFPECIFDIKDECNKHTVSGRDCCFCVSLYKLLTAENYSLDCSYQAYKLSKCPNLTWSWNVLWQMGSVICKDEENRGEINMTEIKTTLCKSISQSCYHQSRHRSRTSGYIRWIETVFLIIRIFFIHLRKSHIEHAQIFTNLI